MPGVLKFDNSDVEYEKSLPRSFERPKPGVYSAKVDEINYTGKKVNGKPDKNQPQLEVVFRITKGEYKGAPNWHYLMVPTREDGKPSTNQEWLDKAANVKWKLDQFLIAMGESNAKKRKGSVKLDDLVGMPCKIRLKATTRNGEPDVEVAAVMAGSEDDLEDDADDTLKDDVGPGVTDDLEDEDLDGDGDGDEEQITPEYLQQLHDEDELDKLTEIANKYDIDPEEIDTWQEVVDLIVAAMDGEHNNAVDAGGEGSGDETDWEALGLNADGDDSESIDTLTEAASERGLDPDEYDTWAELAQAIAQHDEEPF